MTIILFRILSRLLELLCILLYPVIYALLATKRYQDALNAESPDSKQGLLIHAASVGEVNAIRTLVQDLRKRNPQLGIVITTTTLNGLKAARSTGVPAKLAVLDLPWLRKMQLKSIDPKLIAIVETEMWLNLLDQSGKQGRNVVFVNARMTARSFGRYRMIRGLLRKLKSPVRAILAQSEADAERFRAIYDVPVANAGNLKFALRLPAYDSLASRAKYGFAESNFIICLGSSRPGEEKLMADAIAELMPQIPQLKAVIAPRHPERAAALKKALPNSILLSELADAGSAQFIILIIDSIGHLQEFYALCDIAVVGGSFYDFGGHNPLEPAFYGKPVIMGPHHSSCQASVAELHRYGAILLSDAEKLAGDIRELHLDPERRTSLEANAVKCLDDNGHSLQTHLQEIESWL